ncbi:MAG TPA: hypothetical protein VK750_07435, partial [Cytophagaceae bacterium]|nr:hypothetical protein [Cytophagaceae bacterium]
HDKNFIGNGYRSLFLSDFSAPYTFLKLTTNIWKIKYTNLFAELNAGYVNGQRFNSKILTLHHLSMNILPNLNIGLFESIMYGPKDSTSTNTRLQIDYMNPIIFLRYSEQYQGATSRNNAFIGMDLKWNFLKHFSLYGQLLLDEFVLDEVKGRTGWWANKQAFQTGLKYINAFGIKNFDLQSEVNYVRPYTYSHASNYTNYTNFNQALAHPMGANFVEWIGIARLQPVKKLFLTGKLFYIKTGEDSSTALTAINPNNNKGGNIFKSYTAVALANTHGNAMLQGIPTSIMILSLQVSYMVRHNLYLDLYLQYRSKTSTIESRSLTTQFVSGGIRWNIPWRLQEY